MRTYESILEALNDKKRRLGGKVSNLIEFLEPSNKNLVYDAIGKQKLPNGEELCRWLDKLDADLAFPGEEMDDFVLINRVKAVAGCGESYQIDSDVASSYAFRRSFFQYLGVNPNHCKAMFVQGDSMQPLINDRDMILFDENETEIREGYIYVLNYDDALMVKRFQRITDGWNICSENPTYSPVPVQGQNLEKLKVFGRVRWFGRVV